MTPDCQVDASEKADEISRCTSKVIPEERKHT